MLKGYWFIFVFLFHPTWCWGALKPLDRMAREEILTEMFIRGLAGQTDQEWNDQQMSFLQALRRAEQEGAVGIVQKRARIPEDYLVLVDSPSVTGLNVKGYQKYLQFKSQEAIRFFEKQGVRLGDVFYIKDPKGNYVFDAAGMLTPDGEAYYDQLRLASKPSPAQETAPSAGQGKEMKQTAEEAKKTDSQAVPSGKKKSKQEFPEDSLEKLRYLGFMEVTSGEISWLLGNTPFEKDELVIRERTDKKTKTIQYFIGNPMAQMVVKRRREGKGIGGTRSFGL